jgi:hypothetical protein
MLTKTKGDKPTTQEQAVIDRLAKWIDPQVIAETLVEELVDNEVEVTTENAQKVYLSHLFGLASDFDSIIQRQF